MSHKSGEKQDGDNIYRAVQEGVWPFIITFGEHYGYDKVFVISRVNKPEAGGRELGV